MSEPRRSRRPVVLSLLLLLLAIAAGAAISVLQTHADDSQSAQLCVADMHYAVRSLAFAAFAADPSSGGSPRYARMQMVADQATVARIGHTLMAQSPPSGVLAALHERSLLYPVLARIYWIGVFGGGYNGHRRLQTNRLLGVMIGSQASVDRDLLGAGAVYAHRASTTRLQATIGSLVAIASLLLAFLLILRARHRIEQALRGSEKRWRTLLDNSQEIVTLIDRQGQVGFASPSVERWLGYNPEELLGTALTVHGHGDDSAALRQAFEDAALGQPVSLSHRVGHKDGSWRSHESTLVSLLDDAAIGAILMTSRDVTERVKLEIEVRLAQKLESVGQLAAGIAHEINTPIQYVSSSVGFLDGAFSDISQLLDAYAQLREQARSAGIDPEALSGLAQAEENADLEYLRERVPAALQRSRDGLDRVATIVAAMRVFGHPPTTGTGPVDLNAAIENTLVVAASEYKYVADVTTDLADIPPALTNSGDINQVLINLIVNASHAIADVASDTGQRGTITICTTVDDDRAIITIADTGPGIPVEIADRVFDPFFTTKEVGEGTGQGLTIARTIIDRDGGQLTFHAQPGEGTTFTIRLPLAAGVAMPAAA